MTCIAWDGKTLASDRAMSIGTGYTRQTVCKIDRLDSGDLVAATGGAGYAMRLRRWYASGADPADWPQPSDDSGRGRMLVVRADRTIWAYDASPYPWQVFDPFIAVGSGAEVATGALAMGATAQQAVEIASRFAEGCGNGVDVFHMPEASDAR